MPSTLEQDPRALSSERFAFQCRMLEQGFHEVQSQIARLDDIAFRIKASAATVWAALTGWSITAESTILVPLGFVVILGFWLLDGMFRGIQMRFIVQSRELTALLNDNRKLDACFERQSFPSGLVYPVGLEPSDWRSALRFLRGLASSTVATLYLFLSLANTLAWLTLDLLFA